MNKEEFKDQWNLNFPNLIPISNHLKFDSNIWLRIHNLPKSKRYAENEEEREILLNRQNTVLTDLFGLGNRIHIVAGEFNWGNNRSIHLTDKEKVFKSYSFTMLDKINLYNLSNEIYDEVDIYRPAFTETSWIPNKFNDLLKEIADDNLRALFISFHKKVIAAPYDGGIDLILNSVNQKKCFKNKYNKWLSKRNDGL